MATSKRFAGVELGGTSWLLAIAVDDPQNIVEQTKIETTTPKETLDAAIAWLKTQTFDAIGIASFGPIDLNPSSPTYGYITSTPKPHWGNTEIVGVFQRAFPDTPIGFETDVNAPALYEVNHGGHGEITSACYITVGTGVGVGVALAGQAVHGHMHPEGGHVLVPQAPADREADFNGVCPYHGGCVEGMVGSPSIAARTGLDRRDVHTLTDEDPIWDTLAHYLAYLCMNLTLTVSPEVIVIGGGISKREKLFTLIREKFEKYLNNYVTYPAVEKYIRPSFHPDIGLVSSIELARLTLASRDDSQTGPMQVGVLGLHKPERRPSSMIWPDLFVSASVTPVSSTPSRLGISFVQASAPEASIPISRASTHCEDDGGVATAMTIHQNLSEYGIVGVVWNCPQLLAKKRVLELGAGTGAVGLAIALHQDTRGDDAGDGRVEALILTDLASVVQLTTQNVLSVALDHANIHAMLSRNALSTQAYCWGDALSESLRAYAADVVLCSDCLYEPTQYAKLLTSLLTLTDTSQKENAAEGDSATNTIVLIAYKQRIPGREKAFFESTSEFFHITINAVDGNACAAVGSDTIYICRLERQEKPQATASMS